MIRERFRLETDAVNGEYDVQDIASAENDHSIEVPWPREKTTFTYQSVEMDLRRGQTLSFLSRECQANSKLFQVQGHKCLTFERIPV